ncbi:MAG: TolC family protein [Schleiferiaceae bacterium]|nr:TolC family protein [Schleiferiaceae bacterium]
MNKKKQFIWLSLILSKVCFSQSILEQYIQEGYQNNQSIQQQELTLEKSVYALKEAKSLFLPSISFMTDYFLAGGGRTVDFPAGDLLNPVYSSLNQLTNSNNFPQLDNQQILLNPDNFYDIKFRTTLPLLNLEIDYNRRIKREQVEMQKLEIDLYKRELAKEIKIAYFQYLQSLEAIKIYENALKLARESKRINESLFENDKANRTTLLRAENEITRFEAIRENAIQSSNSVKAYFNFLINKDLNDPVLVDSSYQSAAIFLGDSTSISEREELLKLKIGGNITQHLERLSKSYIVPKLNTFLDLGSQGFDWQYDNNTRYYFFGVSLQWDVFASGRNHYKIKQAQLDNKILQAQTDYVFSQLQLQFNTSVNNFNTSVFSYQAAISTFNSSQKFYADILRLYKEGQALYIELLDAQNQLIQSELQVNISLYDTYIKAAEIERANASLNVNIHSDEK